MFPAPVPVPALFPQSGRQRSVPCLYLLCVLWQNRGKWLRRWRGPWDLLLDKNKKPHSHRARLDKTGRCSLSLLEPPSEPRQEVHPLWSSEWARVCYHCILFGELWSISIDQDKNKTEKNLFGAPFVLYHLTAAWFQLSVMLMAEVLIKKCLLNWSMQNKWQNHQGKKAEDINNVWFKRHTSSTIIAVLVLCMQTPTFSHTQTSMHTHTHTQVGWDSPPWTGGTPIGKTQPVPTVLAVFNPVPLRAKQAFTCCGYF